MGIEGGRYGGKMVGSQRVLCYSPLSLSSHNPSLLVLLLDTYYTSAISLPRTALLRCLARVIRPSLPQCARLSIASRVSLRSRRRLEFSIKPAELKTRSASALIARIDSMSIAMRAREGYLVRTAGRSQFERRRYRR
jgi:hypothetical protein